MILRAVFFLIRVYLRIFNSIKVVGLEKIPSSGPLILAANHVSNIDPPIITSHAALARKIYILAKKEFFVIPVIGAIFKHWGAVPLDRGRDGGDLGAFRTVLGVLRDGACLIIFPEGTRARPGHPLKPKQGVSLLAAKSGAPVMCVRIFNSENFLKLGKITIKFGNLRYFEPAPHANPKESYEKFSELIMSDIFSITED